MNYGSYIKINLKIENYLLNVSIDYLTLLKEKSQIQFHKVFCQKLWQTTDLMK